MNRRRFFCAFMALVIVFSVLPVSIYAQGYEEEIKRISGNDRIETALEVSKEGWEKASTIIITPSNQENLIDSVIAAPLAGQEDAPLLFTDKGRLEKKVWTRILELGAHRIFLVGPIKKSVEKSLRTLAQEHDWDIEIVKLKGKDRIATAQKVNALLHKPAGTFVIGYTAVADALSASSYATAKGYAFVFADDKGLLNGQELYGEEHYILGGPGLVRDIKGSVRIYGQDRLETNQNIIEYFDFDHSRIYLANGQDRHLVDTLAGSVLAGKTVSPIYLLGQSDNGYTENIRSKLQTGSKGYILGGQNAVPQDMKKRIMGQSDGDKKDKDNNVVGIVPENIRSLSLNEIEVRFNTKVNRQSAEDVTNYFIDGRELSSLTAMAELQDDKRTVVLTLNTPKTQYSEVVVEIKDNEIYSADRKDSVDGTMVNIIAGDTVFPDVNNVTVIGNRKVSVRFSEAIVVNEIMETYQNWKLDGKRLTLSGLNEITITKSIQSGGQEYTREVDFHFGVSLSAGKHVLEVSSAISASLPANLFSDSAGFRLRESTTEFTVADYGSGQISVDVDKTKNENIFVRFSESMYSSPTSADSREQRSALNSKNYLVNDQSASVIKAEFVPDTAGKMVKLTVDSDVLAPGVNILAVNKNIEDMYCRKLGVSDSESRYQRILFTVEEDRIKPQVETVRLVTPFKIRVSFSEQVDRLYAENMVNYKLYNRDNVQLRFKSIMPVMGTNDDSKKCGEYLLETSDPLYGEGYTLKIAHIIDNALNPNTMEPHEALFDGRDSKGPDIREAVSEEESSEIVIFFSEEMDSISLLDLTNYSYIDGDNHFRKLPAGTKAEAGPEGKSVRLILPSAYKTDADESGISGLSERYRITAVQVSDVKDSKGFLLEGIRRIQDIIIPAYSGYQPAFIPNSFAVEDDGEEGITAVFKLDQRLNHFTAADFKIGSAVNKITSDWGYLEGRKIVLRFSASAKVEDIRSLGSTIHLYTVDDPQSSNFGDVSVRAFPAEGYQIYDDSVNPRFVSLSLEESPAGDDYVLITFSEAIDGTVTGLYEDDFIFYHGGTDIKIKSVSIHCDEAGNLVPNVLKYDLADGDYTSSGFSARMMEANLSIRDITDRKGDQNTCLYKKII